jgi:hypothetical protein
MQVEEVEVWLCLAKIQSARKVGRAKRLRLAEEAADS